MKRLTVVSSYNITRYTLEDIMPLMCSILEELGIEYSTVKVARGIAIPKPKGRFSKPQSKVAHAAIKVTDYDMGGPDVGRYKYDRSDSTDNKISIVFLDRYEPKGRNFFTVVIEPNKLVRPVPEG